MEQPQSNNLPTLESNLDQLVQELHRLANRVKPHDQHQQCEDAQRGRGQCLTATGRS